MEKLALLGRMAFTASMPIALGLVIVTMWDRGQEEFAETLSKTYPGHQADQKERAQLMAVLRQAAKTKRNLVREKFSWDD
ncbi:hypothetical protein Y1Q_0011812 [Alligator mississippiensis]|uniref:Ubiquinol-cytochrome-c reductase complex assembly factor 3 n=1 Tax=Alligator mississippiensis TaxID=8496 RepID=A0A151NS61_ALLMI|nr:hypothetical protein Y1Q_0011812 [Alligator mississippiensis]